MNEPTNISYRTMFVHDDEINKVCFLEATIQCPFPESKITKGFSNEHIVKPIYFKLDPTTLMYK